MRLLTVEVRRLLGRRMVALVALAGLVAVGLVLAGTWASARPLSDAQIEQARTEYEFQLREWEQYGDEWVEDCLEQEERDQEISDEPVDYGCEEMGPPEEEWFLPEPTDLAQTFGTLLSGSSMLLAFLVFVVGATATAAEMSTGSMSTWLTFVPQRMRVLFSKVGASAVVAVPLAAALTVVLVAGLYVVHAVNGALGDLTGEVWADVAWTAGRIALLAALVGALGAALGVLLRHTGAVLGVVAGYALVLEGIIGGLVPRLQPYLLTTNLLGWVDGGTTYWVNECEVTAQGTACTGIENTLALGHSAVYLAVVAAVVLTLTALVFRRRDVA